MSSSSSLLKNAIVVGGSVVIQAQEPAPKESEPTPKYDHIFLEKQAKHMVEMARIEANRIIEETRRQAPSILEQAKAEGFKEGYRQGFEQAQIEAQKTCDALISSAQKIVFTANEHREHILSSIVPIATEILMESVRTLLAREMSLQKYDVESVIENLLKYVIHGTRIEIRVHPEDYDNAVRVKPKIQDEKLGEWDVMVIADPDLGSGSCKIRSDSGYVDASMDTKVKMLRSVIERHIGRIIDECNERVSS